LAVSPAVERAGLRICGHEAANATRHRDGRVGDDVRGAVAIRRKIVAFRHDVARTVEPIPNLDRIEKRRANPTGETSVIDVDRELRPNHGGRCGDRLAGMIAKHDLAVAHDTEFARDRGETRFRIDRHCCGRARS
jgi:hypothetical protein